MAIYHLCAGFISRSTGKSTVQSAAYITGQCLSETRRGLVADYRGRASDVAFHTTLAPQNAPEWMHTLEVWDKLEEFEDSYAYARYISEETRDKFLNSAQTAQTLVTALPKELALEDWEELVKEFAHDCFVSRGLVVTAAIHKDEGNPHAHFMVSRRAFDEKTDFFSFKKDREIVTKGALNQIRKLWADKTNAFLERAGLDLRIDHRSYADRGLKILPTQHEGWYAHKLEGQGIYSHIAQANKDIRAANAELIVHQPEEPLKLLSQNQATFSKTDLLRLIQRYVSNDALIESVAEACLQQCSEIGISLDGEIRYATVAYQEIEKKTLELLNGVSTTSGGRPDASDKAEHLLADTYSHLSSQQQEAVRQLCSGSNLGVLVGRAGTGKTTRVLKAVVEAYRQSDYEVVGMALSAVAADNLAREAVCQAETIAFYVDKWKRFEDIEDRLWSLHPQSEHAYLLQIQENLKEYQLHNKSIVIVDEAGMVGTQSWLALLEHVKASGAKLIAVGDDHQFKAIDAGDLFRKIKDMGLQQGVLVSLTQILRQNKEWMREASQNLAVLRTYEPELWIMRQSEVISYSGL